MENETKIYSTISLPVFDEKNHKLGNLQFLSENEFNAYKKIVRKSENMKFVYDQRLANKFILDLHENGIEFTEENSIALKKDRTNAPIVKRCTSPAICTCSLSLMGYAVHRYIVSTMEWQRTKPRRD